MALLEILELTNGMDGSDKEAHGLQRLRQRRDERPNLGGPIKPFNQANGPQCVETANGVNSSLPIDRCAKATASLEHGGANMPGVGGAREKS